MATDAKKIFNRKDYTLIGDFPTHKEASKAGDKIALTAEGAAYLQTLKKIK